MADLIKKIKIKKQDGTFTDYIPIGAEADNINFDNGYSLSQVTGDINPEVDGSIKEQLNQNENNYYNRRIPLKETLGSNQAGRFRSTCKSLGLKYVRIPFVWQDCEPEKGVYSESAFQGFKTNGELYLNIGIKLIVLLVYNNTNYGSGQTKGVISEENREGFANFCGEVARRMAGLNVIYSIWNEPNVANFWSPLTDNSYYYTEMFKSACQKIRENDNTAKIAGPELAGMEYREDYYGHPLIFFQECCKYGLLDYTDYVSFHNYGGKYPEKSLKVNSKASYNLVRAIMRKYTNREIPIIVTESGGSTYTGGLTQDEQAAGIVKMYLIDHAEGIKLTTIYECIDSGTDANNPEHNFGMVLHDGVTLKQSGRAVKFMSSLLGDCYFLRKEQMTLEGDYCYVYDNEDNNKIYYIYWTDGVSHNITIPNKLINSIQYSMYGTETTVENNTLEITNNPIYIEYKHKRDNHYITSEETYDQINKAIGVANEISKLDKESVKISRNNIFQNADLAQGLKYITNWGGSTSLYEDSEMQDTCLKITSVGQGAYFNKNFKVKNGDIVTWSCWVRIDSVDNVTKNILIGPECGESWSFSNYKTWATGQVRCYASNKWMKISKTFIVSHDDRTPFVFYTQDATKSNPINIYIYHPQMVIGEQIADDFAPSLLDFLKTDDLYTIGTFTPTLVSTGNAIVDEYGTQVGNYIKIKKLIIFSLQININTVKADRSGYAYIQGLPFKSAISLGLNGKTMKIDTSTHEVNPSYAINSTDLNLKWTKKADGTTTTAMESSSFINDSSISIWGIYLTA